MGELQRNKTGYEAAKNAPIAAANAMSRTLMGVAPNFPGYMNLTKSINEGGVGRVAQDSALSFIPSLIGDLGGFFDPVDRYKDTPVAALTAKVGLQRTLPSREEGRAAAKKMKDEESKKKREAKSLGIPAPKKMG